MADNEPSKQSTWRHWLAAISLAIGGGLFVLSFVWPVVAPARGNWSPEQAEAYQAASHKLHSLSGHTIQAAGSNNEKEFRQKLEQAKAEYDVLRRDLDDAIERPKHVATAMRIAGFVLAAVGLVEILTDAPPADTRVSQGMSLMAQNHPVALITGASSGIGKALAENFAEHGYDVILTARSVDKMEAHAAELQKRFGITALVIAADLESPGGATELHAEIKRRGITLSALANNAGFGTFGEFKDATLDSQLAMMQLNMSSVVALARLFLPDLIATKGKMLNTASTAAFQPGPYMAVYYATKAFVLSFSEALAAELALLPRPKGEGRGEGASVTVTAFCPGPTASGFQDKAAMHHSGLVKGKKLPTSEEVARKGFRAMQRGRRVYIPGWKNWLLAQLPRLGPRRLVTRIVIWVTGPVE